MNMTLKNVPGELHRRLVARAKLNHRSLNSEIIAALESKVGISPRDRADLRARIKSARVAVDPTLLNEFKKTGRR